MASPEEQLDAQRRLTEVLWSDPEIRRDFLEPAIAKKIPSAREQMPSLVVREETAKMRAEIAEERAALAAERQAERDRRAREAWETDLMNDPTLRIRRDEIPEVEKLMVENVIGEPRAAARLLRASQQVAPARGSARLQVPGLNGAGGDDYKTLISDPDNWARNMAEKVLSEFGH